MRKTAASFIYFLLFSASGLFLLNFSVTGQETVGVFPGLPDNVNKIVSVSCVPCHTSKGRLLPRVKLNFTGWSEYSPEIQKEKADKIYSELNKGTMPPKSAREARPEIIPAGDQINTIKKWAESFNTDSK